MYIIITSSSLPFIFKVKQFKVLFRVVKVFWGIQTGEETKAQQVKCCAQGLAAGSLQGWDPVCAQAPWSQNPHLYIIGSLFRGEGKIAG